MSRNCNLSIGEYYHAYNRGTDKRKVFLTARDYQRFIGLLYLCNNSTPVHISNHRGLTLIEWLILPRAETLVDIGAYCLMPNHFHILMREKSEGGISLFMQKLSTAYTMYFNKKKDRTGSLFAGTFKTKHVNTDEYLKYTLAYIHLNPVKLIEPHWEEIGIQNSKKVSLWLHTYKLSSYLEYLKDFDRPESVILNKKAFPEYFSSGNDFENMITNWLEFKKSSE